MAKNPEWRIKMEENRKELMEILEETRPDIDFENETGLIDKEMLDSFNRQ